MADENHEGEMPVKGIGGPTLRDHYKSCPKSASHPDYIPVSDFCMEDLPLQYRTECMLALVKALVRLTVFLKVNATSDLRAAHYLNADKNATRGGSGCVVGVRWSTGRDKGGCPCEECQRSGNPRQQFAKVVVQTSAHIVFDIAEGRATVCYFDFDSDSAVQSSCPNLSSVVNVNSHDQDDVSFVTFVTHDLEFIEQLDQNLKNFRRLYDLIHTEADFSTSSLYIKYQEMAEECSKMIDRWKNMTSEDVERMMEEQKRNCIVQSEEGKSIYLRLLECRARGGNEWKQGLAELTDTLEWCSHLMEGVRELVDKYKSYADVFGERGVQDKCRFYHQQLELIRGHLQNYSAGDEYDKPPDFYSVTTFYESHHPLTMIVSHPHGFRKQISVGHVIERHTDVCREGYARYTYTATTCPGSAGAPVFILGRRGQLHLTQSHSASTHSETSRSGVLPDL